MANLSETGPPVDTLSGIGTARSGAGTLPGGTQGTMLGLGSDSQASTAETLASTLEPAPASAGLLWRGRQGKVIADKYRLDFLVARGGMGEVWAATHLSLGQRVAVKLISRPLARSSEARARFDAEAKSAASLVSRFVVRVYDNGETADGVPYIVMEFLEGESLEARLERLECLGLPQVVRIVGQIGRALDHAHARGIVHRDLKPENVFLSKSYDDEKEVAKVLDFGVAKVITEGGSKTTSVAGSVLGTPLFMSPEQARGFAVDHRSDLYSLGMVAYNMLTGAYAFSRPSVAEVLAAICTDPLPRLRDLAGWLPPALDQWFARACAREPNRRFASGAEMAEALRVAANQPHSALSTTGSGKIALPADQSPGDSTAPVAATRGVPPYAPASSRLVGLAVIAAGVFLSAGVGAAAIASLTRGDVAPLDAGIVPSQVTVAAASATKHAAAAIPKPPAVAPPARAAEPPSSTAPDAKRPRATKGAPTPTPKPPKPRTRSIDVGF